MNEFCVGQPDRFSFVCVWEGGGGIDFGFTLYLKLLGIRVGDDTLRNQVQSQTICAQSGIQILTKHVDVTIKIE